LIRIDRRAGAISSESCKDLDRACLLLAPLFPVVPPVLLACVSDSDSDDKPDDEDPDVNTNGVLVRFELPEGTLKTGVFSLGGSS
jgi:hypothetical protein